MKRTPDTSYEPSENSNITDLGSHGREAAYEKGNVRRAPIPSLSHHDSVQGKSQHRLLGILQKIPGHEEKKGFFPEQQLTEIVTEEYIKEELQLCFEEPLDAVTIERLARIICGTSTGSARNKAKFKKIFAILILCEKPEAIQQFLEENVSDRDLPLRKIVTSDNLPNIFKLERRESRGELGCFRGWSSAAIWRFEEWQWTTMAPFFHHGKRREIKHFILQDQAPLPFNTDSRFVSGEHAHHRLELGGGFSNVFKVSMHPEHHDLYKPGVSFRYT